VVDNNSCQNISSGNEISSAVTHVRMSELIQTSCDGDVDDDNNSCYANAQTGTDGSCIQTGSCGGTSDTDIEWTCTFPLQYHADSTVTGTPKVSYNWIAAIKATDDDTEDTGLIDSTTYSNEMDKFMAYDLTTASIAYGTVAPNNDSSEKTTTVEATGNVGLDENLSGGISNGKGMCTDYPTCSGSYINTVQQVYNLTSAQGWAAGTALSYTAAETELNCDKTTITGTPATANTYWYLRIPAGQAAGSYTGQNIIEGKVNNETYGS